MKAICSSGTVCLVSARLLHDNVKSDVYTRVRVRSTTHEIDLTTEKETAELKSVKETGGGKKKEERTLGREGDCEQGRRGRRASVELIRARVFEEPSRWNALQWSTHHERYLFHS